MKNLAIITARGGSKRIPRKNIKDFLGKPLISYSISAALDSKVFDEVMVSTDDEEIAEVAKKYGAKVPFLRSSKTSDDFATTADVLGEVLNKYSDVENFCCIYPTAPFLSGERLHDSFVQFEKSEADTMISTCQYSYPVQRSLKNSDGKLSMLFPEHINSRSQDLEPVYHDAGQFYWAKVDKFLKSQKLFTENSIGYELSELEVQDIDTLIDWELAEIKYSRLNKKK